MKRYHANMTTEPITFRTWALMVDSIDESDFLWLDGFGMKVTIDSPSHTFDTINGRTHTVRGKPSYSVDTTTDKQRNMLKLKYGNLAMLIQEDHVLPGSMSTCTLSGINWNGN